MDSYYVELCLLDGFPMELFCLLKYYCICNSQAWILRNLKVSASLRWIKMCFHFQMSFFHLENGKRNNRIQKIPLGTRNRHSRRRYHINLRGPKYFPCIVVVLGMHPTYQFVFEFTIWKMRSGCCRHPYEFSKKKDYLCISQHFYGSPFLLLCVIISSEAYFSLYTSYFIVNNGLLDSSENLRFASSANPRLI